MHLSNETEAAGYRLLARDATESTNDDCVQAARAGDPGKLWIAAREQHAGRGRHGRQWSSPPGNLYASLLLIDPCEIRSAPQLGFVAGLALHEAVESLSGIGAPRLALKWPNDLLLDGAKVSGLLLEGHRIGADQQLAVVIGFGVNVAEAPTGTPYPATSLRTLKSDLTVEDMFVALSNVFARIYAAWQSASRRDSADPFGAIRRLWLDRAAGIGQPVTIRLPNGEKSGTFTGLDRFGRLQLDTPSGGETVDAGDLYFSNLQYGTAGPMPGATRF